MATEWCVSMASPLTDFTEIAYEGHTRIHEHNTVASQLRGINEQFMWHID